MKKMIFACLLALVLAFGAFAAAEPAAPHEDAYRGAKEAISLISYGEYEMAVKRLKMENVISAKALKQFIDQNCPEIYMGSVQTEVSVAWPDGMVWKLAVPFEAPEDEAVGSLVFTYENGGFTKMEFARWGIVCDMYGMADQAIWNVAYTPNYVIVEDW